MGSDPGIDIPEDQGSLLKEILTQQKTTNELLTEILGAIRGKSAAGE
jgi:hypothetical protein